MNRKIPVNSPFFSFPVCGVVLSEDSSSASEESSSEDLVVPMAPATTKPRCQVARPVVPDSDDEDPDVNLGMVKPGET